MWNAYDLSGISGDQIEWAYDSVRVIQMGGWTHMKCIKDKLSSCVDVIQGCFGRPEIVIPRLTGCQNRLFGGARSGLNDDHIVQTPCRQLPPPRRLFVSWICNPARGSAHMNLNPYSQACLNLQRSIRRQDVVLPSWNGRLLRAVECSMTMKTAYYVEWKASG